jgi:hypothetical protein
VAKRHRSCDGCKSKAFSVIGVVVYMKS